MFTEKRENMLMLRCTRMNYLLQKYKGLVLFAVINVRVGHAAKHKSSHKNIELVTFIETICCYIMIT